MNLFQKLKVFSTAFKLKAQFFYQNKLNNKKYLALAFLLAYTPYFIYYLYQYRDPLTLRLTQQTHQLSQIEIPQFARKLIFGAYSRIYNVNQQEMIKKLEEYKTFSEFFTRKIQERPIHQEKFSITSPCDGRVLSFSEIKSDSCFVVKDYNYSFGHLLCGEQIGFSQSDIQMMKKGKENKLYHVILYLAPGDYHRFHAPINFQVTRRKQIQGFLLPVKVQSLPNSKVYQKNARLIMHGKWEQGYFGMILVGALNVGRIIVKDKTQFQKGQQMGYFNLGSTILLLLQGRNIKWEIQEKQLIKYGQILCKFQETQDKIGVKV